MASHQVVDDRDGVALISPAEELRVAFAPAVGMVGYSLTHRGEELLGLRGGLTAYRERGSSFGIPLLHPWANRLTTELDAARPPVRVDANGLPIHGLLAASPHWSVVGRGAAEERAWLAAALDFGAHDELLAAFPYPHELRIEAELAGDTLTVATELAPTSEAPVPISFGWHPYLRLPGTPRSEWRVELPVATRALLDERGIPTGRTEAAEALDGPLGDRVWDDLYTELERPAVFALEDERRRVEVRFREEYPVAQVYAPADADHVCFEPMTAPTNALVTGGGLRHAQPGERFRAEFALRVLG